LFFRNSFLTIAIAIAKDLELDLGLDWDSHPFFHSGGGMDGTYFCTLEVMSGIKFDRYQKKMDAWYVQHR